MINHPLFNDDDSNEEKQSRDIGYINIRQFEGSRGVMLVGQWEPEQLQTAEDIYNAVGAGHFELIGRHARTNKIVDRVSITVKMPRSLNEPPPKPEPRNPDLRLEPPPPPAPPSMQAGNIVIPPGMDPQTAMMVTMMALGNQQNAAQLQAAREDSRHHSTQQTQLMLGLVQSFSAMTTGLAAALSGHGQPSQSGANSNVDAFLKGIETMADLRAGMKEEQEESKPTPWNEVTRNIADGIRNIVEVAKVANAVTPSGPVVPPGVPGT